MILASASAVPVRVILSASMGDVGSSTTGGSVAPAVKNRVATIMSPASNVVMAA